MRGAREKGRGNDERWHLRKDGSRFFARGRDDAVARGGRRARRLPQDPARPHRSAPAGQALAESEARAATGAGAGGVGLFTVDMADNVLTPTPEFCRLYGSPSRRATPRRRSRDW